jgi:hypothetical protein
LTFSYALSGDDIDLSVPAAENIVDERQNFSWGWLFHI